MKGVLYHSSPMHYSNDLAARRRVTSFEFVVIGNTEIYGYGS